MTGSPISVPDPVFSMETLDRAHNTSMPTPFQTLTTSNTEDVGQYNAGCNLSRISRCSTLRESDVDPAPTSSIIGKWKRGGTLPNNKHRRKEQQSTITDEKSPAELQYITGGKLVILLTSLITASFLSSLNASIVATAIPKITDQFHSVKDIGWYGSAYLVTNCVFLPMSGKLYSFYKAKIVFLCFLAVFEIGSLMCATAVSSDMFIGGRVIAGAGAAGIFSGAFTIVAAAAPAQRRPLLQGITMSESMSGQVIGPLIGGALTQNASWRWCFYINVPVGVAIMPLIALIAIPSSDEKHNSRPSIWQVFLKLDVVGFALFTPACIFLLLAVELGGTTHPWNSSTIIGFFCGAGEFALVWLAWDYWRGEEAMIPLSLFRDSIVSFSCVTAMLSWGGLLVLTYYLPIWFQTVKGENPLMSGLMILPTMISQTITGLVSGWLVTKLGYYLPWGLAGNMATAIGSGLLTTFAPQTDAGEWIGYQILTGAGRGVVLQIPIFAVQAALPPPRIPVGTGLINFCQYWGGTFFVAFAQTVFSSRLPPALSALAPDVDINVILGAGATEIRSVVSPEALPGVLAAYNQAITQTFYLAVGAASVASLMCLGMGWRSVKETQQSENSEKDLNHSV